MEGVMDQIILNEKMDKWFWYYGVLPLVISYVFCLNFAAEMLLIKMTLQWSGTLFYMGELLFYTTLGLAFLMIIWCIVNAARVFVISSKIELEEFKKKKLYFRLSAIIFPIIAFVGFIPLTILIAMNNFYLPLYPFISPIAHELTPYLFPIYVYITNGVNYFLSINPY